MDAEAFVHTATQHLYFHKCCISKRNNLLYLKRKLHQSTSVWFSSTPLSRLNWNLEMLVFVEGGINREKTPRSRARTNNKLNLHMGLFTKRDRRVEPGTNPDSGRVEDLKQGPTNVKSSTLNHAAMLSPTVVLACSCHTVNTRI